MKLDSKKILTIGAGAVVGYLLFCKLIKNRAEKSLEGGEEAPAEEGGIGGGGGGFGGGGGAIPPVVAPIITPPAGYVVIGGNTITARENLQIGNPNALGGGGTNTSTQSGRETPPPPPAPTDVSGAPVVLVPSKTAKFSDFDGVDYDGNANQDSIL